MTYCVIVYDRESKTDMYQTDYMTWGECRWFEDYVRKIYPDVVCSIFC